MHIHDCNPEQSSLVGSILTSVLTSTLQCPSLPFQTTPHQYTCSTCKCLVCKKPAELCSSWGNGTKVRANINGNAAAPEHGSTQLRHTIFGTNNTYAWA